MTCRWKRRPSLTRQLPQRIDSGYTDRRELRIIALFRSFGGSVDQGKQWLGPPVRGFSIGKERQSDAATLVCEMIKLQQSIATRPTSNLRLRLWAMGGRDWLNWSGWQGMEMAPGLRLAPRTSMQFPTAAPRCIAHASSGIVAPGPRASEAIGRLQG